MASLARLTPVRLVPAVLRRAPLWGSTRVSPLLLPSSLPAFLRGPERLGIQSKAENGYPRVALGKRMPLPDAGAARSGRRRAVRRHRGWQARQHSPGAADRAWPDVVSLGAGFREEPTDRIRAINTLRRGSPVCSGDLVLRTGSWQEQARPQPLPAGLPCLPTIPRSRDQGWAGAVSARRRPRKSPS